MEDRILRNAADALRGRLVSPMRILGTDRFADRGFAFVLDEGGRRHRLVLDVDPDHPTLHLEPAPRRDDWRGGFGQRLRGGFLVDARPDPEDRRVELDVATRTIEATFRLHATWHGRGGNLWLIEVATGSVLERLRPLGPGPGEPWSAPAPDPRPSVSELREDELALRFSVAPLETWTREVTRTCRGVSRPRAAAALARYFEETGRTGEAAAPGPGNETADAAPGPGNEAADAARFVVRELRRGGPEGYFAYRLAGNERLPLPRPVPAEALGLPPAWVSAGPLELFSSFETDPEEEPSRRAAPDRLLWLQARTYRVCVAERDDRLRRAGYARRIESERRRLERIGEQLRKELSVDEGPLLRRYAEAILAHLHLVERGDDLLVCPDLSSEEPGVELRIPLDPARPAAETANAYFHRARRAEKGRPLREMRLGHVERALEELVALGARIDSLAALPPHDEIEERFARATGPFYRGPRPDPGGSAAAGRGGADPQRARPSSRSNLSGSGSAEDGHGRELPPGDGTRRSGSAGRNEGPGRGANAPTATRGRPRAGGGPSSRFRPRTYQTSDGWTVVVGRSNEENDYVTLKVAKQDDLWFHAHGVPGSHVVLKREGRKDNPSKKTIEEAAEIAAFFSKARSSSRAPVIYTLKKYVTKPRKAKAGLVTCTREKSIMVRPRNPDPDSPPEWTE